VELLDLQIVWIARHLYLRRFGRWPGRQVLHTAFERLREECCLASDRRAPQGGLREFLRRFGTVT
jgi:hypothetical protein